MSEREKTYVEDPFLSHFHTLEFRIVDFYSIIQINFYSLICNMSNGLIINLHLCKLLCILGYCFSCF